MRHFLTPPSFGKAGFYRYDVLKEIQSKEPVHGAAGSCTPCHQELATTAQGGKHTSLSCEICHAPLAKHAANNAKIGEMPSNRAVGQCGYCHQKLRARPESIKQIEFKAHLVQVSAIAEGDEIPENACIACHDPHNPGLQ